MESTTFLSITILFSWLCMTTSLPQAPLPCTQALFACQTSLQPGAEPTEACCSPLKKLISDDLDCLCTIFNNQQLLEQFNVTKEIALQLPTLCGVKDAANICNKNTNGSSISPASSLPSSKGPLSPPSTGGAPSEKKMFIGISIALMVVELFR